MPSHPAAKLMQGELRFLGQLDPAKVAILEGRPIPGDARGAGVGVELVRDRSHPYYRTSCR